MGGPLKIEWEDEPDDSSMPRQTDPAHPNGRDVVDNRDATSHCVTQLPYPATGFGSWIVTCGKCRKRVYLPADGQPDDPRSLSVACTLAVQLQKVADNA